MGKVLISRDHFHTCRATKAVFPSCPSFTPSSLSSLSPSSFISPPLVGESTSTHTHPTRPSHSTYLFFFKGFYRSSLRVPQLDPFPFYPTQNRPSQWYNLDPFSMSTPSALFTAASS